MLLTSKVMNSPLTKAPKMQVARVVGDALQVFHSGLLKKNPKQTLKKSKSHMPKNQLATQHKNSLQKNPKPTKRKSVQFQSHCCFVHEVVIQGIVLPALFV